MKKRQWKTSGQSISKSKATISKYEKNEIIPDSVTLLELCNCLDISLSDLLPSDIHHIKNYSFFNPFNSNHLYAYYYTDKKLITSIIDVYPEDNTLKCKFFNGVKNIETYRNCSYYYEGVFESNKTTAYFTFNNCSAINDMLEKVQIVLNIPWSNEITICKGLILGLTPNALPIVKKVIVTSSKIIDISKYNKELLFSKEDSKKMYHNGALIIENKNYDEFFFDS